MGQQHLVGHLLHSVGEVLGGLFVTLRHRVVASGSADRDQAGPMTSWRLGRGANQGPDQRAGELLRCGAAVSGALCEGLGDLVGHHHAYLGHSRDRTGRLVWQPSISPDGTVMEVQVLRCAPWTACRSGMSAPLASLPAGWVAAWTARSLAIETRV
jgi:hypothetical protein